MHVLVQCSRLASLVRTALSCRRTTDDVTAAVRLAEYLWQSDPAKDIAELVQSSATRVASPVGSELADIVPEVLHFHSVQDMVLCMRFWTMQMVLCGLTDTLHRHFPSQSISSNMPCPESVHHLDINAGLDLMRSLHWIESATSVLPFVGLHIYAFLQIAIGPWYRVAQGLEPLPAVGIARSSAICEVTQERSGRAMRLKDWLVQRCNAYLLQCSIAAVDEEVFDQVVLCMAGERNWGASAAQVRFESLDGEAVLIFDSADASPDQNKPPKQLPFACDVSTCTPTRAFNYHLKRPDHRHHHEDSRVSHASSSAAAESFFQSGRIPFLIPAPTCKPKLSGDNLRTRPPV
ncbi:unnamed protein product [Alternaria alternata]